jgi:hypothetical protein
MVNALLDKLVPMSHEANASHWQAKFLHAMSDAAQAAISFKSGLEFIGLKW